MPGVKPVPVTVTSCRSCSREDGVRRIDATTAGTFGSNDNGVRGGVTLPILNDMAWMSQVFGAVAQSIVCDPLLVKTTCRRSSAKFCAWKVPSSGTVTYRLVPVV